MVISRRFISAREEESAAESFSRFLESSEFRTGASFLNFSRERRVMRVKHFECLPLCGKSGGTAELTSFVPFGMGLFLCELARGEVVRYPKNL